MGRLDLLWTKDRWLQPRDEPSVRQQCLQQSLPPYCREPGRQHPPNQLSLQRPMQVSPDSSMRCWRSTSSLDPRPRGYLVECALGQRSSIFCDTSLEAGLLGLRHPVFIDTQCVTRFLDRNKDQLMSLWTTPMTGRHEADSGYKYSKYFELLHGKNATIRA